MRDAFIKCEARVLMILVINLTAKGILHSLDNRSTFKSIYIRGPLIKTLNKINPWLRD